MKLPVNKYGLPDTRFRVVRDYIRGEVEDDKRHLRQNLIVSALIGLLAGAVITKTFSREHKKDTVAVNGHTWAARHWINNEEPGMIHPFSWLINKFWPIPSWKENWQEIWEGYK